MGIVYFCYIKTITIHIVKLNRKTQTNVPVVMFVVKHARRV